MNITGHIGRAADLYSRIRQVVHEFTRYGIVGAGAFVVDVGAFNLLQYAGGSGPLHGHPLVAKSVSVVLATTVAYFGNRHWTFRHRLRSGFGREYGLFFLFSGVGLGIALACLLVSRDVIGLRSPLADNIAANVIGLALGAAFRFWSYRTFVFPALVASDLASTESSTDLPLDERIPDS